jgi:hypothetical protein
VVGALRFLEAGLQLAVDQLTVAVVQVMVVTVVGQHVRVAPRYLVWESLFAAPAGGHTLVMANRGSKWPSFTARVELCGRRFSGELFDRGCRG